MRGKPAVMRGKLKKGRVAQGGKYIYIYIYIYMEKGVQCTTGSTTHKGDGNIGITD